MDGPNYTAHFEAPDGKPVLKAYPDPITKGTPWTIGLGHTGTDIVEGVGWTEQQCWNAFYNDYAVAYSNAARQVGSSCWSSLSEPRRAVLADMAFQMGGEGLGKFEHMLEAVRISNWPEAKAEMLDSTYARQTPNRARTNSETLETGEWPEDHLA